AMAERWILPGGFLRGVAWLSETPRLGPRGRGAVRLLARDSAVEEVGSRVLRGRGSVRLLAGDSEVEEVVSGFRLRFPAGVFFQANPLLAGSVFELIAEECRGEDVLELYAGMGALTVHLARKARNVVAVEGNAEAARAVTE